MSFEYAIVDAFTDVAFGGNPAAVVLLSAAKPDEWLQSVATELNLSETAFADVTAERGVAMPLRWFTPAAEVALCGHATLATAHVLGGDRVFSTKSGNLSCTQTADGWIKMDFPADLPTPVEHDDVIARATTGLDVKNVARGVFDLLIEVATEAELLAFVPSLEAISAIGGRGVIVTAPSDRSGIDFVSRCFYPLIGVPEDPVTGSAHTTLASWWQTRLEKSELVGRQLSKRGGEQFESRWKKTEFICSVRLSQLHGVRWS